MRESVVSEELRDAPPILVEQILGGADAQTVDAELERLSAVRCFFFAASIGALFGIELGDGRRVALKVHQQRVSAQDLEAVQSAQAELAAREYPCPRPVLGPTPFLDRLATGDEWRDDGAPVETVDDARRLQMAALLAHQITLCAELPAASVLAWVPRDERLWPTPHNALFEFERTAAGAEWIDEIAAESRKRNRAGPRVLAHQDWSVKHFRWEGDAVTVIYDWDSLFVDNESISVGAAAATHTYPPEGALPWTPNVDDAVAFLDAYERERPLDAETRRAAEAHAVYSTAYTCRCEHAIAEGHDFEPATGARAVLREFAARLL